MPKALDLSTLSPERARQILQGRAAKKAEYQRKKEFLLERAKAWRAENPDKLAAYAKEWRETNRDQKAATTRAWYERNRDALLAREAARWQAIPLETRRVLCRRPAETLSDGYVRSQAAGAHGTTGLRSGDIPDEILPLFRAKIIVKRELQKLRAEK